MQAADERYQVSNPKKQGADSPSAWSYRLVVTAILSVTAAFIIIMGLFAFLRVFDKDNAANITAALSSLFGIVGTLVGAYFGIKASSDAQDRSADTAQQAVTQQKETAQTSMTNQKETAQRAVADQKETVKAAVGNVASEAPRGARSHGPTIMAAAALIPLAGGTGVLILHHYLKRLRK